jgi:hypothetical protein
MMVPNLHQNQDENRIEKLEMNQSHRLVVRVNLVSENFRLFPRIRLEPTLRVTLEILAAKLPMEALAVSPNPIFLHQLPPRRVLKARHLEKRRHRRVSQVLQALTQTLITKLLIPVALVPVRSGPTPQIHLRRSLKTFSKRLGKLAGI